MRELKDNKTGLIWVAGARGLGYSDQGNGQDKNIVREHIAEINGWKSNNITQFITWGKVGDYLSDGELLEDIYFAYDSGRLAGVSVVNGGIDFRYQSFFAEHIDKVYNNPAIEDRYMSIYNARRALRNATDNNNTHINFVVVSPSEQGKGVGTRMIRSISSNINFFSGSKDNNIISAKVHFSNKASNRLMQRSEFEQLSVNNDPKFFNYFNVM